MKNSIIYTIALLFILNISASKVDAQDANTQLWEKANTLFSAQDYQQAINTYEQILNSGQESAKLYFNLGNAYYKSGRINNAILNYERAKLLSPGDEDIEFNLRVANQFVVTRIEDLPKPFFSRWKQSVSNIFNTDKWAMFSIISFLTFLGLLGLYLFGRIVTLRRIAFFTGIAVFLLSVFSFSFAATQKNRIKNRNHAIVFSPRVTVKSSPSQTGTDLFLIYEGLKVEITDQLNKWNEIKLADGNKGWLPDSCVVKI
jgi:tetratricopeptide (TPR) repeat protein